MCTLRPASPATSHASGFTPLPPPAAPPSLGICCPAHESPHPNVMSQASRRFIRASYAEQPEPDATGQTPALLHTRAKTSPVSALTPSDLVGMVATLSEALRFS